MPIGFQDDPTLPLARRRARRSSTASRRPAPSIIRTTADWSAIAPTRPANATEPVRPRLQLRRPRRRSSGTRSSAASRCMLTIWGTPTWANGGKGAERAADAVADLQNFARALADRYSGRHAGYPFVGYYSIWNEPNLRSSWRRSSTRAARSSARRLREALPRRLRRHQGRQPEGAGRDRRDLAARPRPAADGRHAESVAPGTFAQLLSPRRPALQFDAWAHHPYPTAAEPAADAEGALAERDAAAAAAASRTTLDAVVQPQGHPDLDHRVRLRDEAGRADAASPIAQQAAYMTQAIAHAEGRPARADVHLVHLPGRDESLWQSGLFNAVRARRSRGVPDTFSALAPTVAGETRSRSRPDGRRCVDGGPCRGSPRSAPRPGTTDRRQLRRSTAD